MIIDVKRTELLKVFAAIHKLSNTDFSEITSGNIQSDIYEIISILEDFKINLREELDE
jgi:hypothetical protein